MSDPWINEALTTETEELPTTDQFAQDVETGYASETSPIMPKSPEHGSRPGRAGQSGSQDKLPANTSVNFPTRSQDTQKKKSQICDSL